MKKTFILLSFIIGSSSFAQVRDLMLKKAGGVINGNKKENTSTGTDSTQTTNSDNTQQSGGIFNMQMAGKKDVRSEYNFTSNVYVQIQNYKKNGEKDGDVSNVRYHFSNEDFFGTEMIMTDKKGKVTESFGVSEFPKQLLVSLINSDGEKTGTAMKVDFQKAVDKANDSSEVKIEKTGKTKTILGYNCHEYIITDKDGNRTETWNTKELNYDLTKMMAGNRSEMEVKGYDGGFMMEMIFLDKNGKKTTWNVIEVNTNAAKKVTTGEYSFPY